MINVVVIALLLISWRCSAWFDPPAPDDFLRRNGPRAVVIDDFVYIDGGYVLGKDFPVRASSLTPANDTLAIDLSKSWYPRDVSFLKPRVAPRKPPLYRSGIVVDENTKSLYLWGGRRMEQDGKREKEKLSPDRVLWKFTPDGKGNGTWNSEVTIGIDRVVRSEGTAYTAAKGLGFWFGGAVNEQTDSSSNAKAADGTATPGFVTFNFTSKAWTNHTDIPESIKHPYSATATYVPSFGPNGLIVLIGGTSRPNRLPAFDLGVVNFLDPVTLKWYSQTTSGPSPSRRIDHCAVSVQGGNKTHEIFIYGGQDNESADGEVFGDVWVLSLPGFVWHRADPGDGDIRTHHDCVHVGKRQLLSIGGLSSPAPGNMSFPDPNPQGLGIFDMTEMKWTENYNSGADPYATPTIIKKWYTDGGLESVVWSDGVQDLFLNETPSDPSPSAGALSAGVIAGTTVGAVAFVAAIATAAFWLFRKRKGEKMAKSQELEALTSTLNGSSSAWTSTLSPLDTRKETCVAHPELAGDTHRLAMRDELLVPGQIPTDQRVELHADERSEVVG